MVRSGQTLITLLIFIIVSVTVAATSVSIIITNAQKTTASASSMEAYYAAEAGIENASIELLRNPAYLGGTITLSPSSLVETSVIFENNQYTVKAKGTAHGYTRTIEAIFDYTDTILSVVSWREVYQ